MKRRPQNRTTSKVQEIVLINIQKNSKLHFLQKLRISKKLKQRKSHHLLVIPLSRPTQKRASSKTNHPLKQILQTSSRKSQKRMKLRWILILKCQKKYTCWKKSRVRSNNREFWSPPPTLIKSHKSLKNDQYKKYNLKSWTRLCYKRRIRLKWRRKMMVISIVLIFIPPKIRMPKPVGRRIIHFHQKMQTLQIFLRSPLYSILSNRLIYNQMIFKIRWLQKIMISNKSSFPK